MVRGSLGFAGVSVAAFAVWAFAGRWFYAHFGEAALYLACACVFLGLSGPVLHPLVGGRNSLLRFYKIFIPAFLGYAVGWCAAWFAFRFGWGEWLGSVVGSFAFTVLAALAFRNPCSWFKAGVVMFVLNSAGYFLGGKLMGWLSGPVGTAWLAGLSKNQVSVIAKLAWGLIFGLGFGAGLGYAFFKFQNAPGRMLPNSDSDAGG